MELSKKNLLQRYIIYKVLNNEYKMDEKLPSEAAFAIKFDISRVQVRNALKELKFAGFITSKKGKGYFLTPEFAQLLFESEKGDDRRVIKVLKNPFEYALTINKKFNIEIGIKQFQKGMLYGYEKQMYDEDGLYNIKTSIINNQLTRFVDLSELEKKGFLTLAAFHDVKITFIKKKVVYDKISFLDKYAKQMGYGDEYPIVVTASYVGTLLLDVSANIFRKDKFAVSINLPLFF